MSSFLRNVFGGGGGNGEGGSPAGRAASGGAAAVERFVDAWNKRDMQTAVDLFAEDCVYDDTAYYSPFVGRSALKRHLLREADALPPGHSRVIDDVASAASDGSRVCIRWHNEIDGAARSDGYGRGVSFFTLDLDDEEEGDSRYKIESVLCVPEPGAPKPGDVGLNILSAASKVMDATGAGFVDGGDDDDQVGSGGATATDNANANNAVERYFDAWNRRDMAAAVACFAPDCSYEDAQYDCPFTGLDALTKHLDRVAAALPRSFVFVVDDLAVSELESLSSSEGGRNIGVKWHVENGDGDALPFTRGCSLYALDEKTGLIRTGFDVPEPAAIKTGALELGLASVARKVAEEPVRAVPLAAWAAYMYVVFFSDGIMPGANALMLEQRTWEEVRDLSLNFFLVAPLVHLPFAPVVHPLLEGVFNLLLSWAAMFAGFLSDEREDKPNQLPMLPIVAGMQFLTSAFFLPYLGTRSAERLQEGEVVYRDDLATIEGTLGEWRGLGALLGGVGTGSIAWAFMARPEFGGAGERYASFVDLLSIDRVGSSFIVDLVIFGLFQGWLVDDDMKRRGVDVDAGEMAPLRAMAKFVPFFGLAAYLTLRPELTTRNGK